MIIKRLAALSLLTLCLLLGGCTAKMSYNYLDWIISWGIDDYIDWDEQQRPLFEQALSDSLQWHRQTQLPRYSDWLRQLQQDLEQPLSNVQLQGHRQQLSHFWYDIMRHIEADSAMLLSTLSDRQKNQLLVAIDKQTADFEDEYLDLSAEKQQRKRRKDSEKFISRFSGRLDKQQKSIIADWSATLADNNRAWLQNRQQWRQQFSQALELRQQPDFAAHIHRLFVEPEQLWSDDYRQLIEHNVELSQTLIISVQAELSAKQHRHLKRELQQWIELLDELATETD